METRQERGLQIAALTKIERNPLGWKVPSQTGKGFYIVKVDGEKFCTCPDFEERHQPCKHVYAVEYVVQRETKADGTTVYTEGIKVTYAQNWPVYNQAQMHEGEHFGSLLRDLCADIPNPQAAATGRPRLPLSDVVFALVSRSYDGTSGRRFTSALAEAKAGGLVSQAAHYNSAFRYLENADLTPLLKALIEKSAAPLSAVETEFAVDSSGFATTTYDRWFDHKWGKMRSENKWIKAHLMCGVKTHVVTSAQVDATETPDNRQLPALLDATARTFSIAEVSADKAYSGRRNLHAIDAIGATAYIPFMSHATGMGTSKHKFDGLWNRAFHFYNFNRTAFLAHYHKRSNVETTFSMIKAKFGGRVRAKSDTAQINEVLCKILAHNICVLIQSMYELGVEPTFGGFGAGQAVAPKPLSVA